MPDPYIPAPQVVTVPPPRHRWMLVVVIILVLGVLIWWLIPKNAVAPGELLPGGGVSLTAQSSVAQAAVGTQFSVDIILDAGSYLVSAAEIVVAYDAQLLKAVDISHGTLLPLELAGGLVGSGRAAITVASGTTPASGQGTVATILFEAIAAGTSDISATSDSHIAAVGYPGDVIGQLVRATVTVQ